MKASELRQKYVEFFVSKNHKKIKSAPLIPENDPTCLFTTAGMHPLVPFLTGQKHPLGKRLVDCQKCVRTGDIDEVGDACHLTFFEMLGNWSLGDYFKEEAIEYSFEFLTSPEWLNIPISKLAVTVFAGDQDAPLDQEAYDIWRRLGIPESRIAKCDKKENWWGPAGQTGPCGPDTEMFFWTGEEPAPENFDTENKLWVEIWNDVFMQYNKVAEGKFEPLSQQNVDTGMGLERVTAALQGKASCYETELFIPIFDKLDEIRGVEAPETRSSSERIIADHLRAATFILADGITPGNVDQPYVLRRLIRRSIMQGYKLGIERPFTTEIARVIIENYKHVYSELAQNAEKIEEELDAEEKQFAQTREKGTREFEKLIAKVPAHIQKKVISGKNAFFLYETYGFPLELTEEMAAERGFEVDRKGFEKAFKKHQDLSRKGAEKKFKGGLADASEQTTNLHTATHLLHQALRQVLGNHVEQRGSNITADRLRFDFSHSEKVSKEELQEVETIVNEVISQGTPVSCSEMTVEEAKTQGAIGLFGDRYGEKVKVYTIGDFSKEICGGPHAVNTSELGRLKIKKEESSSRGVRRIKAVLIKE
ncbi:alanine--tRNA ligase [Lentisphaerota bacterium ZTH]|nr:alanine--tRNA ligase [Lentisphaerota bacterium]WET05592.1 alanine--tRNA ligase [Lentisphaerota bacterium ZTH]